MAIFQTLSLVVLIGFVSSNPGWIQQIDSQLQIELESFINDKTSFMFDVENMVSLEKYWRELLDFLTETRTLMNSIIENIPFDIEEREVILNDKETAFKQIASKCYYRLTYGNKWIQGRLELLGPQEDEFDVSQHVFYAISGLSDTKKQVSTAILELERFVDNIYQRLGWLEKINANPSGMKFFIKDFKTNVKNRHFIDSTDKAIKTIEIKLVSKSREEEKNHSK